MLPLEGADCVALFSGGLDSLAGALLAFEDGHRPLLLSIETNSRMAATQRSLQHKLRRHWPAALAAKAGVELHGGESRESRGRGCLARPVHPDDAREKISLQPYVERGQLQRIILADHELAGFVSLARALDDGEPATLTVAEARRCSVATDDRKARRMLTTLNPQPPIASTAAIVRAWAAGRSHGEVREGLRLSEQRASFLPPRNDPDGDWWKRAAQ